MTLNELCSKLWAISCEECPCEMGIRCAYGKEPCDYPENDCIDGVLKYWERKQKLLDKLKL